MTATAARPRGRARLAWGLSAAGSLGAVAAIVVTGSGSRVAGHWESTVTMLFASFLAGSSPEGGGAVAFPVFTKALHTPAELARTFGLSIQAVGMGMASVSILLFRRPIHVRATVVGGAAAVAGFVTSLAVFGRSTDLFWPPSIPTPWIKATFSIVLATTSVLMVRHLRSGRAAGEPLPWNRRLDAGVAAVGLFGGFLSSLTGTGANIALFLFLVVVAGVNPKVALPSAIVVMAAVSVCGLLVLGLLDGQLRVEVDGSAVTSVGGEPVALPAARGDLLGLWLAAVPVVVWGAPLGSWVASLVRETTLVRFVGLLAAVEVATTFVLVRELRTDAPLVVFLVGGLAALPTAFVVLERQRTRVFATGAARPEPDPGVR